MRLDLQSVGEGIADRKFTLHRDGQPPAEIHVFLGKPQHPPSHSDYFCPRQLKGLGDEKVRYSCGVDAFQAIQLAMDTIGVELDVMGKESQRN